jgi:hypothetical protein
MSTIMGHKALDIWCDLGLIFGEMFLQQMKGGIVANPGAGKGWKTKRGYLATFNNYHLTRKNASFHLHIMHCHLWG